MKWLAAAGKCLPVWVLIAAIGLGACSSASSHGAMGTVTGTYVQLGGAFTQGGPNPPRHPISGTIIAKGRAGSFTATTNTKGTFVLRLPSGHYALVGRSYGGGACGGRASINVLSGQPLHVEIDCIVP
jgi:hypothetical protein